MVMKVKEWAQQCAERLHEQWPTVGMDDLENLAEALQREDRWRDLPPREAALEWLVQGIPVVRRRDSNKH
jgi:hypothetical protein